MPLSHTIPTKIENDKIIYSIEHKWCIAYLENFYQAIKKIIHAQSFEGKEIYFTFENLQEMDSAGAWLIHYFISKVNKPVKKINIASHFTKLLKAISYTDQLIEPPAKKTLWASFYHIVYISFFKEFLLFISYLGNIFFTYCRIFKKISHFPYAATHYHIKKIGVESLYLIGLLTFLIGVVLAYQGALQLKKVGADIYTVNLIGMMTLREMGILLVAVIIIGRSGSAITAQIGSMSANEEIDAIKVMGLNPLERLALPRITALLIIFPLLTFYANFVMLIGGGVGCYFLLDMNIQQYILTLQNVTPLTAFWTGLIKAPFFAFFIGLISTYEGFKVEYNAARIGPHTTSSVVKALFSIIVLDAGFSIFFTVINI